MEQQPQTAVFPVCQYIKGNGNRCGSPALSGARFCYHHFGGSVSALKSAYSQAAGSRSGKLDFVDPISREAIQRNLFVIAQGINDGKLDLMVANVYHRLFRTCEINLSRWERANKDNPEKQMTLPNAPSEVSGTNETEEPALSLSKGPTPHPDSSTITSNVVISTEANRAEEPALHNVRSTENSGAPSFAQRRVGEQPSPTNITSIDDFATPADDVVILSEAKDPALSLPERPARRDGSTTTLEIPADRDALYNSEQALRVFREIDKRYMYSPEYGQRTTEALDALLRGGPVHDWLNDILKSTGFSAPITPLEINAVSGVPHSSAFA